MGRVAVATKVDQSLPTGGAPGSLTGFNIDCGTLAGRRVYIGIQYQNGGGHTISGVTVGGVAATALDVAITSSSGVMHGWECIDPPTGSQSVVVSYTGGSINRSCVIAAVSYEDAGDAIEYTPISGSDASAPFDADVTVNSDTSHLALAFVGSISNTTWTTDQTELADIVRTTNGTTNMLVAEAAGASPSVTFDNEAAASIAFAGFAISVPPAAGGTDVFPGLGELAATGLAPVVQTPRTVTIGFGEVAATGFAPAVLLPVTVSTGLGELVVTGFAPTVLTPLTLLLDVGTATLTGFAPTIQTPVTVTPGTGLLTVTGFAPTLGDEVNVEPGLGELVATGFAPTVQTPLTLTLGLGEVTVTGFAPTVLSPVTVLPGFGELVFAGFAPTIGAEPIATIVIDPVVQNLSPTMTVRNVSPTVVARRR